MAAAFLMVENHLLLILLLCSGASGVDTCIYARPLNISAPNLEALRGSCLLIPCVFTTSSTVTDPFDPTKPVQAIWSKKEFYLGREKESSFVFYDSDWPSNTSLMTMIGDRREKNCTTLFSNIDLVHSDKYFLRIVNDKFKASVLCDPLRIKVRDVPRKPFVSVSGQSKEQESVTITCTAPTPCPQSPPKLSWSLHPDPPHTVVTNADGTFNISIQHTMTLSDRHDGLRINCAAVYPVDGGEKSAARNLSLKVEYSPKDTSVQLSGNTSVSVGESVNLSCSSRARPPAKVIWFRVGCEDPLRVHEGLIYNFILNHSTQGQYFCQAQNRLGEQNSALISLETEGMCRPHTSWIVGGGVGLLILICGAISIWCLLSKRRRPQDPQVGRPPQSETYKEVVDRAEDTLHYGELVFTKATPHRSTAKDKEETVYSEVRVPRGDSQDIYATVKKR